jgi:hypothetical protein
VITTENDNYTQTDTINNCTVTRTHLEMKKMDKQPTGRKRALSCAVVIFIYIREEGGKITLRLLTMRKNTMKKKAIKFVFFFVVFFLIGEKKR